jgi:hypothetical protein
MPTFITRVELHHADEEDYKTLHAAMEDEGFSRTVVSDKGVRYHLPTAEYGRQGDLTKQDVLNSAKTAANITGCKFAVIVTESNGSTWGGLSRA